jgi:pilus assembly protein CpaB
MVVAVGCGLVASYMTSRVIADRGAKEEVEKVTVLVAKQNIPMGTFLKEPEKFFEEKQFTKGEEPKKAIRELALLKDRRLNKPINQEAFVTQDDVNEKGQDGLGGVIPNGYRAVGIRVTAESTAGGFVMPHSHVDIVSVVRRSDTETYSKIILQNVLVLAVDTLDQRPEDKKAMVVSTVTVQVTPQEAEKLSLAKELGTLQLIMRPFDDNGKVHTVGVTPKGITSGSDGKNEEDSLLTDTEGTRLPLSVARVPDVPPTPPAETKQEPPPPPPPPKTHTLTIYNGESVTRAVFTIGEQESNGEMQIDESPAERSPVNKTAPRSSPAKP